MLTITSIHSQSSQGMTRPFYCTASDGKQYFVKGLQATRQSQVNEWICAHLARAFGLPLPPFELLYVEESLHNELPRAHKEIGIGYAFGSQEVLGDIWLESREILNLSPELKRAILVFDKWIRNNDRTQGNPNLILDSNGDKLFVIDHNLAFDPDFSHTNFLQHHLFADEWEAICSDWVERTTYTQRLDQAFAHFPSAWQSLPAEWQWANNEGDLPARLLGKETIDAILKSYYADSHFWHPAN